MDDILFKVHGVHFLEPQVSFDVKIKIKPPAGAAKTQRQPSEGPGYMKKLEKKPEETITTPGAGITSALKKGPSEVLPKLKLALKMQVAKQDLKNRSHF